MGFSSVCEGVEKKCRIIKELAEGGSQFSPKEPQTQQDYEDLTYLLGSKTLWLHIESQD